MSFSISADEFEELPVDPLDEMLDEMDEDVYAGTYIDTDGKKCITVTNENTATQKFAGARSVDLEKDIVIEKVQYSLAELKQAQEVLLNNCKELNITLVGLKPSINGLAVFMPEVTEKSKKAVLSISPIQNIKFYANDEFGTPLSETDDNDIENYDDVDLTRASRSVSVKAGQYLKRNSTNDYWSSVGYHAQIGSQKGFITCAHGWNKNASAYLANGTKLGTITKIVKNNTSDAAFVASDFGWYGLQDGIKARGSGNAAEGEKIIFDGARHYQNGRGREEAKVIALNGYGTTDDGQSFSDALVFDKQSLHGDSGAAVLVDMYGNGSKYKLVGFVRCMFPHKGVDGPNEYSWGAACQWKYVKSALGCKFTN